MAKRIAVTKENREFLLKTFGISKVALWKALTYKSDSMLSRRVRKLAEERGGVQLLEVEEYDPTTLHDADGWMRQYFGNGAMIEFNKEDGHANVHMRGELVQSYKDVKVAEICGIQQMAAALR